MHFDVRHSLSSGDQFTAGALSGGDEVSTVFSGSTGGEFDPTRAADLGVRRRGRGGPMFRLQTNSDAA